MGKIETMKNKIQIKNRYTKEIIFESKTAITIKECIKEVVNKKINLFEANLSRADLPGANLSGANLSGADLFGANLSGANLSESNLSRANLSGANLFGADLSGANLFGANLFGADLSFCKMDKKVFKQITKGWFGWEIKEVKDGED